MNLDLLGAIIFIILSYMFIFFMVRKLRPTNDLIKRTLIKLLSK